MEVEYGRCAGADVHKKMLVVSLRTGARKVEQRKCGTTTSDLREMATWLKDSSCEMFAMESTGSYWEPIYNVLEDTKLPLMVVNPRTVKSIPGKKTDEADADRISDLLRYGLLTPSFIMPREDREAREAETYLQSMKQTRTAEVNRLQKLFEGCNIKISGTISDIRGKSGRALLDEYLKTGSLSLEQVRQLREDKKISGTLKASDEQIVKDFEGSVSPLKLVIFRKVLEHLDYLDEQIEELRRALEDAQSEAKKKAAETITILPGIAKESSRIIIDVLGPTLETFPTPEKLTSWAGTSPGNNESAGKRRSGRTGPGNKLLKTTLVQCAQAAVRCKDSFLHAKYCRLAARIGSKKAIMAIANTLLKSIWRLLRQGIVYEDLGADYYNKYDRKRKMNKAVKSLAKLGLGTEAIAQIKEIVDGAADAPSSGDRASCSA